MIKLNDILNESREFVIIDPRGNARPVGSKVQGAMYLKKMGGPKKGYHLVLAKNAMKARRAIEKNGGNATNSKIQNIMFDLMYETVNEAVNVNYWKGYHERSTKITGGNKVASAVENEVRDWNKNNTDGPSNNISSNGEKKVMNLAHDFFKSAGWISSDIIQAMITQEG